MRQGTCSHKDARFSPGFANKTWSWGDQVERLQAAVHGDAATLWALVLLLWGPGGGVVDGRAASAGP